MSELGPVAAAVAVHCSEHPAVTMNRVTSASPMTRGGFVLTGEAAPIVEAGAVFGFIIVAAEHMLRAVQ